ncbi:MAG: phage holin family protein [Candidatus Limnocylindrales bacterium]
MIDLLVKVLINAAGVWAAIQLVPQIKFDFGDDWWKLLAVALILALVNSYLKPILRMLSLPITLMTMGVFAFVLNAVLLLLVSFVSSQLGLGFTIGGFPPDFTSDSFVGALLGSLVISVVATLLGMLNAGRRFAI